MTMTTRTQAIIAFSALALMLATATTTVVAQTEKIDYAAASRQLSEQGRIVLGNGDSVGAQTLYEQAMVANPQNAEAYVGLGRTFVALEQSGKGLSYFGIALEIEPTNLGALEGQALAHLIGDDVEEAERSLTRIRRICAEAGCPEERRVTDAIAGYLEEHVAENKG